jgi:rhodanese-related sulfurtransferase
MSTFIETVTRKADEFLASFSKEFRSLQEDEFKSLLRRFRYSARLIDVSTKEEFLELHIPGSANCDVLNVKFATKISMMDKSKAYFIYCRNGSRSQNAMYLMQKMGFKRVYNLLDGIQTWKGTVATANVN